MRPIFLLLLGLLAGVAPAFNKFLHYQIQLDEGVPKLKGHYNDNPLSIAEIKDMVAGVSSYQGFLESLKGRAPSLFEHFILLHHSGSLQKASPQKPRTILFGDGLLMSFAEDHLEPNRSIELIQLEADYSFSFHEITFKATPQMTHNPETCRGCHGERLRPIWEPYDFWPKVYGSHLSRFGTVEERRLYYQLSKTNDPSSILSHLIYPEIQENYNHLLESFTQYITMMTMMNMVQEWKHGGVFQEAAIFPVAAVLNGCTTSGTIEQQIEKLKNFLSPAYWEDLESSLAEIHHSTKSNRDQFKSYLVNRYHEFFPDSQSLFKMDHNRLAFEIDAVAQLRFILERMGVYLEDFAQTQGMNPYFMSVPGNAAMDLLMALIGMAPQEFMALDPRFTEFASHWPRFDCKKLKRKAKADQDALVLADLPVGAPKKQFLGTCISCHSFHKSAPYIPFDDSTKLSDWLEAGGLEKIRFRLTTDSWQQMPPAQEAWTREERLDVLSLLEESIL